MLPSSMPAPILMIPIMVAIFGLVLIAGWIGYKQDQKRLEALRALAGRLGWAFDPTPDSTHDEQYAHFEIFRQGHSRVALNTLTGAVLLHGQLCPAKCGDFRYRVTSGSGKDRRTSTYRFSYLIVHTPYPRAPDLLIRREHVLDKIGGAFGFDDIDFESAEFSRRFCVRSPDKRFAYDVIDARMMEFLLSANPPALDMEHGRLLITDGTRRWEPAEFLEYIQFASEFFARWPRHVVDSLQSKLT